VETRKAEMEKDHDPKELKNSSQQVNSKWSLVLEELLDLFKPTLSIYCFLNHHSRDSSKDKMEHGWQMKSSWQYIWRLRGFRKVVKQQCMTSKAHWAARRSPN
jgi:hypothetical protein